MFKTLARETGAFATALLETELAYLNKRDEAPARGNGLRRAARALFCALLPVAAWPAAAAAQTSLGSVNLGSSGTPVAVTVSITMAGTVSGVAVVAQGAPNQDFASAGASGDGCTGNTFAAGESCTVNVTFTPKFSGTRYGAVVLSDASNEVLGTAYIAGMGMGPQAALLPDIPSFISIGSGFSSASGVAVDGAGNVYVADGSQVYKETYAKTAGVVSYNQSQIGIGWTQPYGVAVDGAGNIFVTDIGAQAVYNLTLLPDGTYSSPVSLGSACNGAAGNCWNQPLGVAVDGAGNVYVADGGFYSTSAFEGAVYELTLSSGAYSAPTPLGAICAGAGATNCWTEPYGVAVDSGGNVYVADAGWGLPATSGNAGEGVYELTLSSGTYSLPSAISNGFTTPVALAVDGNGNVYVADSGAATISELIPTGSGYSQLLIANDSGALSGVALDGAENVYVADSGSSALGYIFSSQLLGFANTAAGATSADSPRTVTVQNDGNAELDFSKESYPADFPEAVGATTDCASSTTLAAGSSCTLSIDFTPTFAALAGGQPLRESVSITTNATPASQAITVIGAETHPVPAVRLAAPANPSLVGNSIIFTATVAGASGGPAPTGSVTFSAAGHPALCSAVAVVGGSATCSITPQAVESYTLSAAYSGDSVYSAASSSALVENIVAAPAASSPVTTIGPVNGGSTGSAGVKITFSASETLGGIMVLTQGNPNLDFTNAGGGTCVLSKAYSQGDSCTVNVTFTPKFAGQRDGAVVLTDGSANVIGTAYLAGTAVGPQSAFMPGRQITADTFGDPYGVAVDGSGNLYVADNDHASIYLETLQQSGSYVRSEIGSGFAVPNGVAVDGAGNVYVADWGNIGTGGAIAGGVYLETLQNSSYVQSPLGSGWGNPSSVAVDAVGNVYVADYGNAAVYKLTPTGGSYVQTSIGSGWSSPSGIAVDGKGNVYVADYGNAAVYMLTLTNGAYLQTTLGSGWISPAGAAVDAVGNVYVADDDNNGNGNASVSKLTLQSNGTYLQTTLYNSSIMGSPEAAAVDGAGNVYVVDDASRNAYKFDYADPPSAANPLTFANTANGSTSSDSPQTVTVENIGNASLEFSGLSYPADFPEAAGKSTDCAANAQLSPNGNCTLSIDFTPIALSTTSLTSLLSEFVSITTNALNATGAQSVAVSGTETQTELQATKPAFSVPAGTYNSAQTVSLSDTTTGATIYYTTNGTTPTASSTKYAGAITVSSTETLEAIATASGYSNSTVAAAAYIIANPLPVIGGISPAFTGAGGAVFVLTVNGSAFVANSTVYWGSSALTTTYVSATQLTAQVPAADITTVGGYTITVQTPVPGGGTSTSLTFEVDTASATAPTFSPTTFTVAAGSSATYTFTLPSGVERTTVSCLNLPAGATCSASGSTLTITTTAATPAGTYQVTVVFVETVSGVATSWILLPILLLPLYFMRRKLAARSAWIPACFGLFLLAAMALITGCGGGGGGNGCGANCTPPPTHQVTSSALVTLTVQ
jgi:sugar lactone lactonase YvrE